MLPLELGRDGKILVDYRCDGCGRTTREHPGMVVHPAKPIPSSGPVPHRCDACLAQRTNRRPPSREQLPMGWSGL